MAPPINVQDWYGDRHTCQIASGALGRYVRQLCLVSSLIRPVFAQWVCLHGEAVFEPGN